jgi:hypothetical protein
MANADLPRSSQMAHQNQVEDLCHERNAGSAFSGA